MTEEYYRVENQQPVQGQVVGEHNTVHQHYYSGSGQGVSERGKAERGSFVDVCVVCALAEEVEAFLRVAHRQERVQITREIQTKAKDEYYLVRLENVKGEVLRIHLSWPPRYGPHEMMVHAKQVMEDYQPRLAVMTGFCAGDKRRVHLGDLVVAERTFFYDTGSIKKDEQGQQVHEHDTITSNMSGQLLRFVRLFQEWKPLVVSLARPVSKRTQRDWLLERLYQEPTGSLKMVPVSELEANAPAWRRIVQELQQGPEPWLLPSLILREKERIEQLHYGEEPFPWHDPGEVTCYIQPLASGSAVRRDAPFQEVQIPVRGAIGIDMEGAAFGRVMQGFPKIGWLVVKGVADYADQEKDDSYHAYAAEAAACYALSLMQYYVTQERLPRLEGNLPASRDGPKQVWMVPYARNPFFTGREEELTQLQERFQQGQAQAVSQPQAMSGLGGIGKTQLAVEYAYRHRQEYAQVLWASAENEELLTTAYTQMAKKLELPQQAVPEQKIVIEAVKAWLEKHQGWLLILDNADKPEVLDAFLPSSVGGQVLVTTQASDLTALGLGFGHGLEVETWTTEQGALFLLHRADLLAAEALLDQAREEDRQRAMELSEELGGLPLALDQAGAYLKQTGSGLEAYQQLYQAHRRQLLKERRNSKEHPETVVVTFEISFNKACEIYPLCKNILNFCSLLPSDAIPEELFSQREGLNLSSFSFNAAISALRLYSLVKRFSREKTLSIHRLVQAVLQDGLNEDEKNILAKQVILSIFYTIESSYIDREVDMCQRYLPLVYRFIDLTEEWKFSFSEACTLLSNVAIYLQYRSPAQVEYISLKALKITEELEGKKSINYITLLGNLGANSRLHGKFLNAEEYYLQAISLLPDISKTSISDGTIPFFSSYAFIHGNLGTLYSTQDKFADAIYSFTIAANVYNILFQYPFPTEVTLKAQTRLPFILIDMAETFFDQGNYTFAEEKSVKAISIYKEVGDNKYGRLRGELCLACISHIRGNYGSAEKSFQDILQELGKIAEPNAVVLVFYKEYLADLYIDEGKYLLAKQIYLDVIKKQDDIRWKSPSDIITTRAKLGKLFLLLENYVEAEKYYKQAYELSNEAFGDMHLTVATSLNGLARLSAIEKDYTQALAYYQRAMNIQENILGKNHLNFAETLENIGIFYYEQNKYMESKKYFLQSLSIRKSILGIKHVLYAQCLYHLGKIANSQRRYHRTERLYQKAIMIWKNTHNEEHPFFVSILEDYSALLFSLNQYSKAEKYKMYIQELQRKIEDLNR